MGRTSESMIYHITTACTNDLWLQEAEAKCEDNLQLSWVGDIVIGNHREGAMWEVWGHRWPPQSGRGQAFGFASECRGRKFWDPLQTAIWRDPGCRVGTLVGLGTARRSIGLRDSCSVVGVLPEVEDMEQGDRRPVK